MSDHYTCLLPVETWAYSGPLLRYSGKRSDLGLLAEALIYYERLLVDPGSQVHFAELLAWFHEQGRLDDLLALIQDGTITLYHCAFASAPILDKRTGLYELTGC